jgi:cell division inhibitor SepF
VAGVWRKTMKYLGLVDDDEFEAIERDGQDLDDRMLSRSRGEESPLRRFGRGDQGATSMPETPEAIIRTIPKTQPSAGAIHRAEPKRFNEARELGERFKDGVPVIMSLQGTEDSIARRLVDFASGLVFAQNGKIELVAQRVYLLTPADVEVSAEERERIKEGGFYNQF